MQFIIRINKVFEHIAAILLGCMTLLIILQVFFRYVLKSPLPSSEELARFAMVWMVMISITIVLRSRGHIAVTYFIELSSPIIQKTARTFSLLCIFLFSIILVIYGYDLALTAMKQIAPASKIPIGWIVMSIPVCGVISVLYTLEDLWNEFKVKEKAFNGNNSTVLKGDDI